MRQGAIGIAERHLWQSRETGRDWPYKATNRQVGLQVAERETGTLQDPS